MFISIHFVCNICLMEFSMNGWTCPFIYDLDMSSVILKWRGMGLTLKVNYMNLFLTSLSLHHGQSKVKSR